MVAICCLGQDQTSVMLNWRSLFRGAGPLNFCASFLEAITCPGADGKGKLICVWMSVRHSTPICLSQIRGQSSLFKQLGEHVAYEKPCKETVI